MLIKNCFAKVIHFNKSSSLNTTTICCFCDRSKDILSRVTIKEEKPTELDKLKQFNNVYMGDSDAIITRRRMQEKYLELQRKKRKLSRNFGTESMMLMFLSNYISSTKSMRAN